MYAGGGAAGCAIASAEKSAPMAHRGTTTDRSLIVRFILVPSPDESSGPLRPPLLGRASTRTLQTHAVLDPLSTERPTGLMGGPRPNLSSPSVFVASMSMVQGV